MTKSMGKKAFLAQVWRELARCASVPVNTFYAPDPDEPKPRGRGRKSPEYDEAKAKKLCASCPVLAQCLDNALKTKDFEGVQGGMNGAELKKEFRRLERRRLADRKAAELEQELEVAAA